MSDKEQTDSGVLSVRALPGANCSSVGSIIDLLFAAGAVSGMLMVAVTVALSEEPVDVIGDDDAGKDPIDAPPG